MDEYSDRVQLCPDGKYRWTYEVNLYKNMSMFYDLMGVMGFSYAIVFIVMLIVQLCEGMDWDSQINAFWGFLLVCGIITVVCLMGYLIWAYISGGRYAALFEMDEESVTHMQMAKTVERGKLIGAICMMIAVATDDTTLGANTILASSVNAWKSEYKAVRKVTPKRRRHLIKMNELFSKNRIYVENMEDYEFVLDFIRHHCPKLQEKTDQPMNK